MIARLVDEMYLSVCKMAGMQRSHSMSPSYQSRLLRERRPADVAFGSE